MGTSQVDHYGLLLLSARIKGFVPRHEFPARARNAGQKRRSGSSAGPVQHGNAPEPATTARLLWWTVCGRCSPEAYDRFDSVDRPNRYCTLGAIARVPDRLHSSRRVPPLAEFVFLPWADNIVHWSEFEHGGYFAGMEAPANSVRTCAPLSGSSPLAAPATTGGH